VWGPLRVRLTALSSELGSPRVVNADRGGSAVGAEWDFTTRPGGPLVPTERTGVRTLVFELRDIGPYRAGERFQRGLARCGLSVFAGPRTEGK